jgi:hypothetical protein
MNERLKHIASSHFPRDCSGDILTTPEAISDFAELIVRECADIADINGHQYESPGSYVRQHFGVK